MRYLDYNQLEEAQLAEIILSKFMYGRANATGGVPASISFDEEFRTAWESPADTVAKFSRTLSEAGAMRVRTALINILNLARPQLTPPGVIEDVLFTIGLMQACETLPAATRSILGSFGWEKNAFHLQSVLLMVIKGMRGSSYATEAATIFVGTPAFKRELVFDALEILMADPARPWQDALFMTTETLVSMMGPLQRRSLIRRLTLVVLEDITRHSVLDVAAGIDDICKDEDALDAGHPLGLILKLLMCQPKSPFSRIHKGERLWLVRKENRECAPWPRLSDAAEKYLLSQFPPTYKKSALNNADDWQPEMNHEKQHQIG